ncbi:LytTR family transcriptional regulator DNA-binding domain-containing protein [Geodermatophilus sp. YIM 151500]|uniref:DNA-binding protein n=1 Tax=Geodermatophilus sp. YIM 151500 TaxID=2984531 RepID=UPI0021E37786|nr:DNA-binding protein [Geodermatophilus sp. YIM 151500]MCV2489258.1 LytTR family transcriptional regulator DNA-binding domain-containing protein [Geodermatophilus sp. YIM 151500]
MNGAKHPTTGAFCATNGVALSDESLRRIAAARERFAAGADSVHGVRPDILVSWYRCREEYEVSPHLERAPAAAGGTAHSIEHDVVSAELGGLASGAARDIDGVDGLATVTDCDGHVLATWGSRRIQSLAADSNLAAWSAWSERASGTNGMGTALENQHPVLVRGPEHWCRGFHLWMCAGVAVRDVVTRDPLATLDISCWKTPLPDAVLPWLRAAAAATEAKLRRRARHTGTLLAAALADAREAPGTPLAVVDTVGKVVLANTEAAVLLGTPADAPAYAPSDRWMPQVPALLQLTRRATARARQDHAWSGSTLLFVPFLDQPLPVSVRPVFDASQVIGALLAFRATGDAGAPDLLDEPVLGAPDPHPFPHRVVALRDDRWVLLDPREIRYAETDHDNVWLTTDQGRLLAAVRGLDRLEQELGGRGFLRVHRRFLVNLGRVREIEPGFKGALFLATDTRSHETVPVARRHVARVRQALGL